MRLSSMFFAKAVIHVFASDLCWPTPIVRWPVLLRWYSWSWDLRMWKANQNRCAQKVNYEHFFLPYRSSIQLYSKLISSNETLQTMSGWLCVIFSLLHSHQMNTIIVFYLHGRHNRHGQHLLCCWWRDIYRPAAKFELRRVLWEMQWSRPGTWLCICVLCPLVSTLQFRIYHKVKTIAERTRFFSTHYRVLYVVEGDIRVSAARSGIGPCSQP